MDRNNVLPQFIAAKYPTTKALIKKPRINPPVGPNKYIKPPPYANTGKPKIPLKI